ncbi:MAG: hypothetical protein DMG61_24140 [Acidobacteria bacterium]|nr:MAG: hypothetical protein DMG61_24140 [Acidobacteriota bacterium]
MAQRTYTAILRAIEINENNTPVACVRSAVFTIARILAVTTASNLFELSTTHSVSHVIFPSSPSSDNDRHDAAQDSGVCGCADTFRFWSSLAIRRRSNHSNYFGIAGERI